MRRLVLGTRGSELARAQTALVEKALHAAAPEIEFAIEVILTRGDDKATEPHGRKGLFTGEIEQALRESHIDVAIHSAKDLPSEPTHDLEICATLPRGRVEDVLITKELATLESMAAGAMIATGSVRRQNQLRWLCPPVQIVGLRGNVPTRLRKFATNPWAGIVLACAGLDRLQLSPDDGELRFEEHKWHTAILPPDEFVPAGGQGVVACQIRRADDGARQIVKMVNHPETLLCLQAEREFLRLLQGDCGTPVGVLAAHRNEQMEMLGQIFDEGRVQPRMAKAFGHDPKQVAAELFDLIHEA